ncbi:zinc finger protein RFP-like [Cetorhinus maximus]
MRPLELVFNIQPGNQEHRGQSLENKECQGQSPEIQEHRGQSPERQEHRGQSPEIQEHQGQSPERQEHRGQSPEIQEHRGQSPERQEHRGQSPERQEHRGQSPEIQEHRGQSPERQEHRGQSPEIQEHRGQSPERQEHRGQSPEIQEHRGQSPERQEHRGQSPEIQEHRGQSPERQEHRGRSPERQEHRGQSPERQEHRGRSPERQEHRGQSPERQEHRGQSPERQEHRGRSPERQEHRGQSPERQEHRGRSPERQEHRGRSPERQEHRGRSPERQEHRGRSPERQEHRGRSPERQEHRGRSQEHRGRSQSPGSQKELQSLLTPVQNKKEEWNSVKSDNEKTLTHIQGQSVKTEKQIKVEFEKLHQFLREEERIVLGDLNLEKEKKSQEMKERIEKITEEISSLSVTVQDIEQELREQDKITFLMKFPDLQKRVKRTLPEPQKVYPLINVGKCIGPLQYRVWKKMLTVINTAPVTFDPNTASFELLLSEDLSSVRHIGNRQQLPDNPARLIYYPCVLGSEGFTSGKHSWEVDVGNKTEWDVGVAKESINRKGTIYLSPGNGFWTMVLREGNEYWACEKLLKRLELNVKPRKIRVCLDYEGGKVSFYNSDNKSHIYTFTATFTEKLYPYFSPGKNTEPLTICPRTVTIQEDEGFIPSSK